FLWNCAHRSCISASVTREQCWRHDEKGISNENLSNAWAHRRCTPIYSHLCSKSAKFVAGVECQFYRQKHRSLRGFFRVLVWRMDQEESHPAGPDQLECVFEAGG